MIDENCTLTNECVTVTAGPNVTHAASVKFDTHTLMCLSVCFNLFGSINSS